MDPAGVGIEAFQALFFFVQTGCPSHDRASLGGDPGTAEGI